MLVYSRKVKISDHHELNELKWWSSSPFPFLFSKFIPFTTGSVFLRQNLTM